MPEADALAGIFERWAVGLIELLGGAGVAVVIALENLFPPVPSELILPLAGFAASRGVLSLTEAIVWATGGSVVGALTLYALGAVTGRQRMIRIAEVLPLVDVGDIVRAEQWFERHGSRAVLLGRMIPLVRSLVSIPAGVERMPLGAFVGYTVAGSLLWNAALIGAGYVLAARWTLVAAYVSTYSKVILVAGTTLIAVVATRRIIARRRRPMSVEEA